MWTEEIFAKALGLRKPWIITKIEFTKARDEAESNRGTVKRDAAKEKAAAKKQDTVSLEDENRLLRSIMSGESAGELHIYIDFEQGSKFPYPAGDSNSDEETASDQQPMLGVYDVKAMKWRHLNFWQYRTYIHANVPRVGDKSHSPRLVSVPWARPQSGFTLLFEGFALALAKGMSVSHAADIVGENDTRIWRVIQHYVGKARSVANYSEVTALGVDETSKKGHNYITIFANLQTHKVLFVDNGKDQTTVDHFVTDFKAHQGDGLKIAHVTADMSLGFRTGIQNNFPNACMITDKFHVVKHANEAVDTVRKEESKENIALRGTKYFWLKNEENLTEEQQMQKQTLLKKHLKTGRACMMREELQEIYTVSENREEAEARMKKLCNWMIRSRLEPMKKLCRMIRNHMDSILNYFDKKLTNAILEGLNNIIQHIKCRARGFRNSHYFSTMIYLVAGEIDIEAALAHP